MRGNNVGDVFGRVQAAMCKLENAGVGRVECSADFELVTFFVYISWAAGGY